MHHAPTDLVGRTVGPYELERLLGQGGFAWVFVGRELDGTPVAVKILKPRYGADPAFEIRFRNEAETAAKLDRSEEHTSELQSRLHLVCRLLLEKKKKKKQNLVSMDRKIQK